MKRLPILVPAIVLSIISGVFQVSIAEQTSVRKINIAIKEFPPLVYKDTKGFCIDLAEIICRKHLLEPEFVMYDNVPNLLKAVQTGVCDIGFAGITITPEREKIVDFSQPFFETGLTIAVKNEPISRFASIGNAVLKVIGLSIVLLFAGLTLVAHLIWWIEKDDKNPQGFSETYAGGIVDAYWWAVVTMSTVGYGDKCPKKISGKAIAAIWMFIGIIWFAGLTATLSSALTVDRIRHGEIADLSDLRGKRVAVLENTTSEDFLRYHNVKMVMASTYAELLTILEEGRAAAVVYDAPPLLHEAKLNSAIKVVGETFARQQYGIVFPNNGGEDLKELFNIEILKSRQNGDYQKIYAKWF